MSTVELQNSIIRQVLEIDDNQMLNDIYSILKENSNRSIYKLSDFEKEFLNESMEDYKNGNVIDQEDIILRNKKWLGE